MHEPGYKYNCYRTSEVEYKLKWRTIVSHATFYSTDRIKNVIELRKEIIMRRGSYFWGFVLIVIGLALLLDNLGLLGNINVWALLWPLILILLGGWILLGTIFRRAPTTEHVSIPANGAQRARIKIGHGAGRLNIGAGAAVGVLMEGDFGGGLDYRSQTEEDELRVNMRVPEQIFPFGWSPGFTLDWTLSLSPDVALALDLDTGAGEARLNLTDLMVKELYLKSGASSTEIDLPSKARQTRVSIEAGAASVKIHVPTGVAARIRSRGGLSSIEVDQSRFSPMGQNEYQSPDFETSENRVEMDLQMGVGSIQVQ